MMTESQIKIEINSPMSDTDKDNTTEADIADADIANADGTVEIVEIDESAAEAKVEDDEAETKLEESEADEALLAETPEEKNGEEELEMEKDGSENKETNDTNDDTKTTPTEETVEPKPEEPVKEVSAVVENSGNFPIAMSKPVADIMRKLKQISVSIGPIKQQDLMSSELHKVLNLSTTYEIKFELKEVPAGEDSSSTKRSKLGHVKIPFEIRSPRYLVLMAERLGSLKIDGRDMSVKFPEEFTKSLEIVKTEVESLKKKMAEERVKMKKNAANLRKRSLHVHNIPEKTDEETLKAMFQEASKITIPQVNTGQRRYAILEFETEQSATDYLLTNKDVQIEDCKVRLTRMGNEPPSSKKKKQGQGQGNGRSAQRSRGRGTARFQENQKRLQDIRNKQRSNRTGFNNRNQQVGRSPVRGNQNRSGNNRPGILSNPMMMGMNAAAMGGGGMSSMVGMNMMPFGMGAMGNSGMGNANMGMGNTRMNNMGMNNMGGGGMVQGNNQMSTGMNNMQGTSQFGRANAGNQRNSASVNKQSRNSGRNRKRQNSGDRRSSFGQSQSYQGQSQSYPQYGNTRTHKEEDTKAMVVQLQNQLAKMEEKISHSRSRKPSRKPSRFSDNTDTYDRHSSADQGYNQYGDFSNTLNRSTSSGGAGMYGDYIDDRYDSGYANNSSSSKRKSDLDLGNLSPQKRLYTETSNYQGGYSDMGQSSSMGMTGNYDQQSNLGNTTSSSYGNLGGYSYNY